MAFNPRRKYYFSFFLVLIQFANGNCQSPYQLKPPGEFVVSGASAGLSLTGFLLSENKHKLTVDEIRNLSSERLNKFDRPAINQYSIPAARTSDVLMMASLAAPFALLLDRNILDRGWESGVIYFETIAVASLGINISKGIFSRPRPYVYNPEVQVGEKQKTDATNSFFSGHTAISAASTFFAAKIFSDYHPGSEWNSAVWVGAAAIPLATGFYRYRAGKHFPTDIIAGYCWGALSGIVIPQLHRKKSETGN